MRSIGKAIQRFLLGKVRHKIGFLLILMLALMAGMTGFTDWRLDKQEADAVVINLAGRQRMLTQKMAKEALAVVGGDETAREALGATVTMFDSHAAGTS